jgi:Uma2 family endonuclease
MAEPARARMTVEEFLRWNSGDDRRHELVDGEIVAMNPPAAAHRTVVAKLAWRLGEALAPRKPCRVEVDAGLRIPNRGFSYYSADLAVTCAPHRRGQQELEDPILVIEVLSPGTEGYDRKTKLPDYRTIPTVREILMIDSEVAYAEIHRRTGHGDWVVEIARGLDSGLRLASIDLELSLASLYDGVELAEVQLPYRA